MNNADLHYAVEQIKGFFKGKVDRSELGDAASKAVANNTTTTADGSVLDARQGKVLDDKFNSLNDSLKSVTNKLSWTGTTPTSDNANVTISNTLRVFTNGFMRIVYGRFVLAAGSYAANDILFNIGAGLWTGRIVCQTSTGVNIILAYDHSTGDIFVVSAITLSASTNVMIDMAMPV